MMTARTLTNRPERERKRNRPVMHLVRVLGYDRPATPGARHNLDGVAEIVIGRGDHDRTTRVAHQLVLAIDDPRMSQRHARVTRSEARWLVEDLGSRNGTFLDGSKVEHGELVDGSLLELGRTAFVARVLEPGASPDIGAGELPVSIGEIRTFSSSFAGELANVQRLALTAESILLHGETGTGKEVLARGIHAASRRSGSFVAVNCGALPTNLVESELFGYRKGAFSGAIEDRPGLVRAADRGTLFLDEIGDLPSAMQSTLLRVLQEREVMPVGATRPIAVDVRVIAASHRDLEAEVAAGRFREDLLARIAGYTLEVPTLRDRREDLGILIAELLARDDTRRGLRIAPEAGAALLRYRWPRNVRELEHVLGAAAALAPEGMIELEHLPRSLRDWKGEIPVSPPPHLSPSELVRRDELRALLAKHAGNIAAVGRDLGVARQQVHRWLERFAIDIADYREP